MGNKTKFAVYFNDEYIGEAESFCVEKGHEEVMPLLKISGDYQADVSSEGCGKKFNWAKCEKQICGDKEIIKELAGEELINHSPSQQVLVANKREVVHIKKTSNVGGKPTSDTQTTDNINYEKLCDEIKMCGKPKENLCKCGHDEIPHLTGQCLACNPRNGIIKCRQFKPKENLKGCGKDFKIVMFDLVCEYKCGEVDGDLTYLCPSCFK